MDNWIDYFNYLCEIAPNDIYMSHFSKSLISMCQNDSKKYANLEMQIGPVCHAEPDKIYQILKLFEVLVDNFDGLVAMKYQLMKRLSEAIKIDKSMTCLNLADMHITEDELSLILDALNVNPNIHILVLDYNDLDFTCRECKILSDFIKINKSIKYLGLNSTRIPDRGLKLICEALKVNTTLKMIGLSDNFIEDKGCGYISDMLDHNKSLVKLLFDNSNISAKGISEIAKSLKNNRSLRMIEIPHVECKDFMDMLKENTTLRQVRTMNVDRWLRLYQPA